MVKRVSLLLLCFASVFGKVYSQENDRINFLPSKETLPTFAIKSNLLYDVTSTFNLGGEFRLSKFLTLDASFNYNPWQFSDNKKFKHFLVQPELRYWINEPFNKHFIGAHLLYTHFNAGNLDLPLNIFPGLKEYRYQGNAYGIGLAYGYQWLLSPHWNLEASFGFGYMYMNYSQYECKTCGKKIPNTGPKHYFGPTKVAISLVYIIK